MNGVDNNMGVVLVLWPALVPYGQWSIKVAQDWSHLPVFMVCCAILIQSWYLILLIGNSFDLVHLVIHSFNNERPVIPSNAESGKVTIALDFGIH